MLPRLLCIIGVLFGCCVRAKAATKIDDLLAAIAMVESGADPSKVGDGGKAIGIYQIHREYWQDSGVPGRWEDCFDPAYSRRVVLAYWRRWCPSGDIESLARAHNGGPHGSENHRTEIYWFKVKSAMEASHAA